MASKPLITFFLLFCIVELVSLDDGALTPISSAVEVLSDSGYFSMGLTLQLANKDLSLEDWKELTIFAPSDQAFSKFGQPSLLDIKYHLSPAKLPGETLSNLPHGAEIPTLRANYSLTVTNSSRSGGKPSINNVVVQDSPVFDDGYVVIYGAEEFFTALETSDSSLNSSSSFSSFLDSFSFPASIPVSSSATRTAPSPNFPKSIPNGSKPANCLNIFESASSLLMTRGFVIMATFLALQLQTSENDTKLTVFAPIDKAIPNSITKFSDYATIFRGHVIQRLLFWKDLQKLAWEGSTLQTVLHEYEIKISWSGDILLLNEVPIIYPDMYVNEEIAIHGLNQMIAPQTNGVKSGESFSKLNDGQEDEDGAHEEYSELGDYGLH